MHEGDEQQRSRWSKQLAVPYLVVLYSLGVSSLLAMFVDNVNEVRCLGASRIVVCGVNKTSAAG